MPTPSEPLNHPPFPELTWTDCDWWEGEATLSAWAGFQSRGCPYGAKDDTKPVSDGTVLLNLTPNDLDVAQLPSAAQSRAFEFLNVQGEAIVSSVLTALLPYYEKLRPRGEAHFDANTLAQIMPPVTHVDQFKRLIGLARVHVHPWVKDNLAYVGLEFGCTWDEEHGLGVMLHGARVVEIGAADVSFAWKPEEAEDN